MHKDFHLIEIQFQMFCGVRNWQFYHFKPNDRNRQQCLGFCFDEKGNEQYFLIAASGNYYQYIGPKNWVPVDYVLKK